jgi:integrase/recombinase XerD
MKANTQFQEYQLQKGNAFSTARQQENQVNIFLDWCQVKRIDLQTIDYNQLMQYVAYLHTQGNGQSTIRFKIKSLEHYFNFLNLKNNPATLVKLQGATRTIPNHLLNKEELQNIFEKQRTQGLAGKRDKVLLSLVIFQAVGNLELSKIELNDVNLMEGKIYIPSIKTSNSRTLELKPIQIILFQDYILNIRPVLLRENKVITNQFLVNVKTGQQKMSNVIFYLLKRLRQELPQLKGLEQVRQSVITNWVQEYGVRQAQYMAGHRFVSSTERYNVDKLDGLTNELKLFHPI